MELLEKLEGFGISHIILNLLQVQSASAWSFAPFSSCFVLFTANPALLAAALCSIVRTCCTRT
jgi:hypothetical protein